MKSYIYADCAATSPLKQSAFEMMIPYLTDVFYNPSQLYSAALGAKRGLEDARDTIASCIGAYPDEIYFTSCGSESDNWVIKSAKRGIITSAAEHHAVLRPAEYMENCGHRVVFLNPCDTGEVTAQILDSAFSSQDNNDISLVSVMTANNELGTVSDIAALAEEAHRHKALFHTDAVQAVGHIPLDVHSLGVDMLSASAHKWGGPRGIGFLYIKRGLYIQQLIKGGSQESGMRAGTENVAGAVGAAAALEECVTNMCKTTEHLICLEKIITEILDAYGAEYRRNGGKNRLPGLMSLSFPGFDGEAILHRMDLYGVCISTGSACDSRNTEISHVLKAVGMDERSALGTVRISLGDFTTADDARVIGESLVKIVRKD